MPRIAVHSREKVIAVTAAWSKTSYNAGELEVGTVSGTLTTTTGDTTVTETTGPVNIPVVSASGSTSVVNLPTVNVIRTIPGTTITEPVLIDTTAFVPNQGGRTWTVSADRKSVSAVA